MLAPKKICIALIALGLIVVTPANAAMEVLSKRRLDEFGAASWVQGGDNYLAWSQAPVNRPRRAKVMARHDGDKFRVNPKGTRAYTGGIFEDVLIYQQIRNGRSDVMGFNLKTENRFKFGGPSSDKWELRPTMSENWILFTRQTRRRFSVLLFNMDNNNTREVDSIATRRGRRSAFSGQVNGNWAVYQTCGRGGCSVFRYNIETDNMIRIPERRSWQYAPSVSSDGDVYFVGSGDGCGTRVELLRRRNGNTTRIAKIGGKDTLMTYVGEAPGPESDLFFDKVRCHDRVVADRLRADVFKVRVQG
jgi:hypothetical protein